MSTSLPAKRAPRRVGSRRGLYTPKTERRIANLPLGDPNAGAVLESHHTLTMEALVPAVPTRSGPGVVKYSVILADPPWTFATYSSKGKGRSAEAHYDCMTLEDIKALPVAEWAARDSVLYLWATVPHLANALAVLSAWGFEYRSNVVWVKERIGTGYWARNRHEHLLIGARGSKVCPRFNGIAPADSVIEGQQRQHSQKPDRAIEIIERYHPDAAKLEMFSRERRPGWDAWGDEVGLLDAGPVATRRWASQGEGVGILTLAEAA